MLNFKNKLCISIEEDQVDEEQLQETLIETELNLLSTTQIMDSINLNKNKFQDNCFLRITEKNNHLTTQISNFFDSANETSDLSFHW
jgi:hypothetical protein